MTDTHTIATNNTGTTPGNPLPPSHTAAVTVTGYPRLHLGLVDLAGTTDRAYGGAGIAIDGVPTTVRVTASERFTLSPSTLTPKLRSAITTAVEAARAAAWPDQVHVEVLSHAPQHAGLGSTTTAVMCVLKAISVLVGRAPERAELQTLSGRGRTSGVGVNAFFHGGFVVDVGQPRDTASLGYRPSSDNRTAQASQLLLSVPMPTNWEVSLAIDTAHPGLHGADEVAFFHRNTPTKPDDALRALADLYHGMLPAILEEDLIRFARALRRFQSHSFKQAELAAQHPQVRTLLNRLNHLNNPDQPATSPQYACGLSSMGPLIFVAHPHGDRPLDHVPHADFRILGPFKFRNNGHTVHHNGH